MNIDVKENLDGHWFYSFAIEKGVAPQTLLAVVTGKPATTPTISIPENSEKINTFDKKSGNERKYLSKTIDSEGNNLSLEQAEYFANSKVRDKNGNLLVVYHGTMEDFSVFDITKSRSYDEVLNYDLPGFYFSESNDESGSYGENIKAYYVNVTNPFEGNTYALAKEKGTYRKVYDYLISQGYDGIIDTEMGEGYTEIIAFHPEQIKLISNKKPTSNPDIRYSRRTTGDDLGIDFIKDKDGSVRITTNDLEIAQNIEKKRRNNSNEAKLEVAEEQRKESLRGLIGEKVIEEVSSDEVTRLRKYIADNMHLKKYDSNLMMLTKQTK